VSTTIASAIAGAAGVNKIGAGEIVLNGSNTFAGATTVTAGRLVLGQKLTTTSSVTVQAGATLRIAPAAAATLRAPSLTIADTGLLDLADNKLITQSALGTWTGADYTGVTGLIRRAFAGGTWTGPGGIATSMPAAGGGLTSIGVATAQQAGYAGGTFGGVSVAAGDVLVMYTYAGDANLDGFVSGDDYAAIDFNVLVPGASGWFNGDFNYDGAITGDDYSAIDFGIMAQGAPFPTGARIGSVATVPEPCLIAAVVIAPVVARRRPRPRTLHG
jgi:autotransporter-associated beta strand protein